MNGNRKRKRLGVRAAALGVGVSLVAVSPLTALAASPPFAYSEEKWATLQDNVLEFDEIAELIHEYNSTVKKNAIDYEDYKGKDSEEIAQDYYDAADEIYASLEYPDSDDSNYGTLLASAVRSEQSAEQMIELGDNNVTDDDTVLWGYTRTEKGLVQSAQQQMISYWNSVVTLESRKNAVSKAESDYAAAQAKLAAGTGTQSAVLTAQETLLNAQSAVTTAESTISSTKETLCLTLGWKYGDEVEIGTLPEPQENYSATVNLEEDIAAAVENNYELKILTRQVKNAMKGTTQRSYETTLASSTEAVKSNVKSAYQSLVLAENQYEQARQSYALEEKNMQTADRQKAAGTISANAYQSQNYTYANAKVSLDTAAMSLLQAQLSYQWAVNGLASTT